MRIGSDEITVFSLLSKYPHLTKANLQILFVLVTNKKRDIGKIIQSLRNKGFVDEENNPIPGRMTGKISKEIPVDDAVLENIKNLDEFVKLGKNAKMILYVLSQIKKSSLQFLADLLDDTPRNIYAILQRLEEKNMVYSFNSKIYHLNARGRRFSPKYYVITDMGRIVAKMKIDDSLDHRKIDELLEKTKNEVASMHTIFDDTRKKT
jgi:DNA-binding PadR family transcriptional regulator